MAKVSFTKLGLSKDKLNETTMIEFNGQLIEVKQYLPVQNKLELISNIINKSADDNRFSNPVKLEVFTILEIIYNYTNINFTEKQKENEINIYNIIISSGLWDLIKKAIPEKELENFVKAVKECSEAVYSYCNSVFGILDAIGNDYSNLSFDVDALKNNLSDSDNLGLLQEILTKLG